MWVTVLRDGHAAMAQEVTPTTGDNQTPNAPYYRKPERL